MSMTATELAAKLNGIAYPVHRHLTKERIEQAKAAGLVIVYGVGDDLMEFAGAIYDDFSCYNGGTAYVDAKGLLPERENIDHGDEDALADYFARQPSAKPIKAAWNGKNDEPAWSYQTDIPHATFDVLDDGEPYCRGIVFALADLQEKPNACADDFAKLFRADDTGQVLVVLDEGDEGPEIQISFKPKGLGVCCMKLKFNDSDEGWQKAEHAFSKIDSDAALGLARKTLSEPHMAAMMQAAAGE